MICCLKRKSGDLLFAFGAVFEIKCVISAKLRKLEFHLMHSFIAFRE
jgi:hypothetical protein